ncbi:MAG: tetratricopeptide repeat protein [Methylococcaceae bacterium]|nr:tetratricopeptide repeat protein [Methylococcaceae bacterium]
MMGRPLIAHGMALAALLALAGNVSNADERLCRPKIAQLVSALGQVDTQFARREIWQPAVLHQDYCVEDRVRTGDLSRAVLSMTEGIATRLSLNQKTLVNFVTTEDRVNLSVDYGEVHVRSHTPRHFDVSTKFVNAGIEGTEFLVSADSDQAQITVYEGTVRLTNPQGKLILGKGQTGIAQAGQAPRIKLLLKPENAVQWALYYPPLIDAKALLGSAPPGLRQAAALYLSGRVADSLAALDRVPEDLRLSPEYLNFRAGLLLTAGRVDQAEPLLLDHRQDATAKSLLAVIALARNQKEQALALAQEATALAPRSPIPLLARSYVEQAGFDLQGALATVDAALRLDPENALAHARRAELLASLGDRPEARREAEKAAALNPRLSRTQSLLGFAQLAEADTDAAAASFRRAIDLDSFDPLARFGLGLAKIRTGELTEGTEDLEIAGNLDPNDSLIRSYLGKAYYEQKRSNLADSQFELAKQYDPKDPTPYFYDAIKKQTENRPVEALQDIQKAVELNDSRAIYRSTQKLDSDLAARSAAQGRIYNNLGFSQRALLEGWKSVTINPSDYSGHRFLADTYANSNRYEMARVSELLQSQLLQPVNVTPIQPHLAETNLLNLMSLGPTAQSFNEFNPLFERDRLNFQATGLLGSRGTWADEVTHSGVWRNLSYSVGQFHYSTDGYRRNNAQENNIYNAFFQTALTPDLSVQMEARYSDLRNQDLARRAPGIPQTTENARKEQSTVLRLGGHYAPNDTSDLIVSLIYKSRRLDQSFKSESEGYITEAQYQFHNDFLKSIVGLGYSDINDTFSNRMATKHANGYLYNYLSPWAKTSLIFGFSFDALNDGPYREINGNGTRNQINPKLGLMWSITPKTTLRLAGFRSLKRPLITDQTIEPTQIAGFNQFFDDYNATDVSRYGVGIDQKVTSTLFFGLEASTRHLHFPRYGLENSNLGKTREDLYRTYLNWAPTTMLALSISYELAVFNDMKDVPFSEAIIPNLAPHIQTHRVPFTANFFHTSGFFASTAVTYVDQSTGGTYFVDDRFISQKYSSHFALVDLGLGYRLPNRLGILRFDVRNLFNKEFNYQGLSERSAIYAERDMFYWPERSFNASLTLAF